MLVVVKLIPADLMAEYRVEAAKRDKPVSAFGLAFIILVWIVVAALIAWGAGWHFGTFLHADPN